jgi:hypothetical protein
MVAGMPTHPLHQRLNCASPTFHTTYVFTEKYMILTRNADGAWILTEKKQMHNQAMNE